MLASPQARARGGRPARGPRGRRAPSRPDARLRGGARGDARRTSPASSRELAAALHRANAQLFVALPAADPAYDYKRIGRDADAVVLMNYDQHWLTSPPGPIAAQDWFVRNLESTRALVPREKLVVAIAGYAYDWTEPPARRGRRPAAKAASFQEALVTAAESEATLELRPRVAQPALLLRRRERTHAPGLADRRRHRLQPGPRDGRRGRRGDGALAPRAPRTPRCGRSGGSTARGVARPRAGSRRSRPATTSSWRGTATSGGSARRRSPAGARSAVDPATRLIVGETYLTPAEDLGDRPGRRAPAARSSSASTTGPTRASPRRSSTS